MSEKAINDDRLKKKLQKFTKEMSNYGMTEKDIEIFETGFNYCRALFLTEEHKKKNNSI